MIINIRRGRASSEGIATSSRPVRWMRGAGAEGNWALLGTHRVACSSEETQPR